jgi:hypothetical protein
VAMSWTRACAVPREQTPTFADSPRSGRADRPQSGGTLGGARPQPTRPR